VVRRGLQHLGDRGEGVGVGVVRGLEGLEHLPGRGERAVAREVVPFRRRRRERDEA